MKLYTIYPNFVFEVEAKNEVEAQEKAYEQMKTWGIWNFDVDIEEQE